MYNMIGLDLQIDSTTLVCLMIVQTSWKNWDIYTLCTEVVFSCTGNLPKHAFCKVFKTLEFKIIFLGKGRLVPCTLVELCTPSHGLHLRPLTSSTNATIFLLDDCASSCLFFFQDLPLVAIDSFKHMYLLPKFDDIK